MQFLETICLGIFIYLSSVAFPFLQHALVIGKSMCPFQTPQAHVSLPLMISTFIASLLRFVHKIDYTRTMLANVKNVVEI